MQKPNKGQELKTSNGSKLSAQHISFSLSIGTMSNVIVPNKQINSDSNRPEYKTDKRKVMLPVKISISYTLALSAYVNSPQHCKFVLVPSPPGVVKSYSGKSKSLT